VGTLVLALRLVLAGVFAVAGVSKLRDQEGSGQALEEFGVPSRFTRLGAVLLPMAEIAVAVALLFPPSARWGALGAAALLVGFGIAIGNAMAHGRAPDCHCFGQVHSEPAGWRTLARNAVLLAMAATVAAFGPGPGIHTWLTDRNVLELAALAAVLVAAIPAVRRMRKWRRQRERRRTKTRMLEHLEGVYSPSGLPVGSPAPDFALRSVSGGQESLEGLCSRGLPVLLVFVHPGCGPCRQLLPQLAEWHARIASRLTIAVLSEGSAEANAALLDGYVVDDVLLQERGNVYQAYDLRHGTPSAVIVDTDRTIGSVSVGGVTAIEELIRLTLRRSGRSAAASLLT
jgi:uncharacterized membrane protein YphA (DoxX/SURF4 family)/thiol-disulfide isomerase/thioredoxin